MAEESELNESSITIVEWKIKTFLDLPKDVDYFLNSPRFSLSDDRWFLQIFPNGRTTNNSRPGWMSLYLRKEYSPTEYHVSFRLRIRKGDGTELTAFDMKEMYGLEDKGWGRAKVIRRSDLPSRSNDLRIPDLGGWFWSSVSTTPPEMDALTPNGILTVFCIASITNLTPHSTTMNIAARKPPSSTRTNKATTQTRSVIIVEAASQTSDGIPTLIENFKDLYLNRHQTDVTILVKGREYFAHRSFLVSRSTIFASMFNNNMAEKNTGRIEIDDCDPDAFEVFLLFLYSGDLNIVSISNAVNLYEIAKKYDISELQAECIRCMIRCLSIDSICDVLHLATLHNESELLKSAVDFFNSNTKKILITPKWHTFISENPLLGNELIIKSLNNLESNGENNS